MQAGVCSTASQRALVGPPLGLWHDWHRRGGRGLLLRSPWRPPRPAVHLDAARHGWFGDRTHRCAWRPLPLGGSGRAAVPDPQPHCGRDVDLPGVHAWARAGLSGRYHDCPWLGCLAVHANDPPGSPLGQVCRLPRPSAAARSGAAEPRQRVHVGVRNHPAGTRHGPPGRAWAGIRRLAHRPPVAACGPAVWSGIRWGHHAGSSRLAAASAIPNPGRRFARRQNGVRRRTRSGPAGCDRLEGVRLGDGRVDVRPPLPHDWRGHTVAYAKIVGSSHARSRHAGEAEAPPVSPRPAPTRRSDRVVARPRRRSRRRPVPTLSTPCPCGRPPGTPGIPRRWLASGTPATDREPTEIET